MRLLIAILQLIIPLCAVSPALPFSRINTAPILDPLGNQSVREGVLLEFTITATDPDEDNLTYSATNLPAGATLDSTTGVFNWTPTYEQSGTYPNVVFIVTDDGAPPLSDSESITLYVTDVNRAPVLDPIGSKTVAEGDTLTFTVTGSDPDGNDIDFTVSNLPSGATFDTLTQECFWAPDFVQSGTYSNIIFRVTDDGVPQLSTSESIIITVTDVNRQPQLDVIGNKTVNEGQTLSFTISASDPDDHALSYFAANLPPGATFTPETRSFAWTPDYTQSGIYPNSTFTVTDNGVPPLSASETITITVNEVNRAPTLDPVSNYAISEGALLTFTVSGGDPDDDELTFSASNLPTGAIFDPATRRFRWTPGYGQGGTYNGVTFTVTDDGVPPLSDSQGITITVGDVNRPPVLDPIGDKIVSEGDTLGFIITATDYDDDSLRYSASNLPAGATFDTSAHQLFWIPDSGQNGFYTDVTFKVTDDGAPALSDSEKVRFIVVFPRHFKYTKETGNSASIIVPLTANPNFLGDSLEFGDEIGIFNQDTLCVGSTAWINEAASITVWGDNAVTPDIDGMALGEAFAFRLWDSSDSLEYFAAASFSIGPSVYQVYGLSVMSWISATKVVPVELIGFRADIQDGSVLLTWGTESESNNYGFSVERRATASEWREIGFVPGHGTTNERCSYSYRDERPLVGTASYRLKQIDLDGSFYLHEPLEVVIAAPTKFALHQNYPNPFSTGGGTTLGGNSGTAIQFELPVRTQVELRIYNLRGQLVRALTKDDFAAGYHRRFWDGRDDAGVEVGNGVYICTLHAGEFVRSVKVVVVK